MNTDSNARTLLASRTQLNALKIEAGQAGDLDMVAICDLALDGDEQAHARTTEVIQYGLGMDDLSTSTVAAIADMLGIDYRWRQDGSIRITTSDWQIDAWDDDGQTSGAPGLAWLATHHDRSKSDESGGWDLVGDIVTTLVNLSE